ncbi:thioredoxin [Mesorhizobium microcysteis]|uniref:Thioredoxin n=1 Tax=Neoaquamicrobium microcysteis TaxID=2682781 RepID=A0A5D4GTB6_9HYPH|nr:thioredoxin [Mesorhizobium microcysteis]TYR31374.1 thioredoxin [Mesorhizobium microcysteis]
MSVQDNPYGGYAVQYGDNGAPAEPAQDAAGAVKDTTTAGFAADVIQESRNQPVLVDFWAPWCGPCKQLAPALEKAVRESRGRVKLVKMNIDEHPAIAGQLGIQSIPAVIAFRDGQPVDGFMGAIPESKIVEFIDKVAGAGGAGQATADALAAAQEVRAEGDLQGAAQIYAAILQQEPENLDALGGLAEVLFDAGSADNAREVLARAPETASDAPQLAGIRAKLALAEQVAELGDPAALERRLAENPKDHQARFDLALIANALGERDQAADHLLAIMKADRTWKDDGARLQLLKFFEAWGMADEATLAARRKLSSLLFS